MEKYLTLHERYRVAGLDTRDVKHEQIEKMIKNLPPLFTVSPIGESAEGRTIYGIHTGNGNTRILMWSQMHGDESTATRTLFDLFNFLAASDEYDELRKIILDNISFVFVPMLNPDGAERRQRENAWNIDLNRDARRQITPEAQLLATQVKTVAPHFAYNLHDQESYYSAGVSRQPATISFLAPPPDPAESVTENRHRAMQVINLLHRKLQAIIPNGVGKWNDTYEPRAFGEWTQSQGPATMLIESGGYFNDTERNFVRKIHFGIFLESLHAIATGDYANEPIAPYFQIPLNRENGMFDRIERQKTVVMGNAQFITDVGYREDEIVYGDLDDYGSLEEKIHNC